MGHSAGYGDAVTRLVSRPLPGAAFVGCVFAVCATLDGSGVGRHRTRGGRPRPLARAGAGFRTLDPPPSGGSTLLSEQFTGSVVADPGFVPLNDACLTGASAQPPAEASAPAPCTGPNQTTPPVPTPGALPATSS